MDFALKTTVFAGTVLVLGAGIFVRWIGPEALTPRVRGRLGLGLLLGGGLLLVGSFGEIAATVTRILRGSFDAGFFLDYLLSTRHGQAALLRSALALALMAWGLYPLAARTLDRILYSLVALGLLLTISWVSHSGTMGTLPLLGDLGHLVGTSLWGGALLYLAWLPIWTQEGALKTVVRRVSKLGMISVSLLLATGLYMSTLHLYDLQALTETSYGLSLSVKLSLVVVILLLAAVNRWLLVPLLERRSLSRPLQAVVRLESLLLLAVLGATGVLTTREPAHRHDEPHDHSVTQEAPAPVTRPLALTPLLEEDGRVAFMVGGHLSPADASFTAVSPRGDEVALAPVRAGHGLVLPLPAFEPGVWRLQGEQELSFTLLRDEGVTVLLLPTPTLAGGGQSEVFVFYGTSGEGEPAVFVRLEMPGMDHASDDDLFELSRDHHTHDPRAHAYQGQLAFAMVGSWEMTIYVQNDLEERDRLERYRLRLEVLEE